MVAPPRSTRAISSAKWAKSADRIDGIISIICGLIYILSQRQRNHRLDRAPEGAARSPLRAPLPPPPPPLRSLPAPANRWNRPARRRARGPRARWPEAPSGGGADRRDRPGAAAI